MTWPCNGFEQRPNGKRKRASDEQVECLNLSRDRQFKRTSFARLPFRTSPTISHNTAWQNIAPAFQRPLTPADSSDEDAHGQANDVWVSQRASTVSARLPASNYKIPSVTIETDSVDEEMDIGPATPSYFSRHATPTPHREFHLLSAPTVSLDERIPTPISAAFNITGNSPKGRRCRATVRHTLLSPTLPEEPYLPSPAESNEVSMDSDPEIAIRFEHANDGLGALSVECTDDDMMEQDVINTENITRPSHLREGKGNGARNARLHMGFRADCDKCQQRVPGHYSHIIWS